MLRVVLDHIVLTSALLNPHGPPARLLDFALQGRLRLFATPRMLAIEGKALRSELLRKRHRMTDRELSGLIADLPVLLCLVPDASKPEPKRTMMGEVLSCAARSHADFLVISDTLQAGTSEEGGTQIVKADQFVKLIGRGVS